MRPRGLARLLHAALLTAWSCGASFAQSPSAAAPPDDPSAPVPPAVVSRDAAGRVIVRAVRLDAPIQVDGRLDERVYQTTPAIGGFVQQEPAEGEPATEPTDAWVFFDADTIYVSARCWDSHPERMVANEMRRDTTQLRQNDTFGVLFDTFHDRRNGFFFYANPIGGLADSQITDENPPNTDWNTVWEVKTGRFEGGWTIEMAIPFKSLRYKPGRQQTWGINLRRVVRWKNEWSHLTPIPRALTTFRGILRISAAATLVGLEAPSGSRSLELKPYGIAGLTTDRTASPPTVNDPSRRFGGDLKYGITQNITADLTVNTDFAQVEVDEQQVNLTRFNLFFPEKRDFFLENGGVFAFAGRQSAGLNAGAGDAPYLFFSRRIGLDEGREVPLRAGGRVTGKVGALTVGLLNVQTGEHEAIGASRTNFTVVRVKRDVLRRSSIGAMATHRSALVGRPGSNDAYGVDASFSFFQNLRIDSYLARTRTGGTPGDDLSYRTFFDYNGDRVGLQAERLVVEPGFSPEIGFVRRTDIRRNFGLARFSPRPTAIPHVRKFTWQATLNYVTDNDDRLETREAAALFQTEFQNSDVAGATYTDSYERLLRPFPIATGVRIPVGAYGFHNLQLSYQMGQQRRLSGSIVFDEGTFYDGDRRAIAFNTGRVEVTPQLSIEPSVGVNWVELGAGRFTTKLVRARGTYTMTPRMFVSGLVQYNSTATSLGSNLRFRWEYRPGSELFVVYTDDYDTMARATAPAVRNRALVVKINRLLRM
jgi:hypothetical protein